LSAFAVAAQMVDQLLMKPYVERVGQSGVSNKTRTFKA